MRPLHRFAAQVRMKDRRSRSHARRPFRKVSPYIPPKDRYWGLPPCWIRYSTAIVAATAPSAAADVYMRQPPPVIATTIVIAAAAVVAKPAGKQDQDDDPPPVIAAHTQITHFVSPP